MIGVKSRPIELKAFASATLEDGTLLYFMPDCIEANFDQAGNNSVDYPIPFDCKLNGIEPILKGHSFGDKLWMQIGYFNPVNPAEFIESRRFGLGFGTDDSTQKQGCIDVPYASTISRYLSTDPINIQAILRINYYKKNDNQAVEALFNLKMHEIVSPQGA